MAYYSKTIQEEELKNKVREEWFAGYDNTDIPGKVDFCVRHNDTTYLGRKPSGESSSTSTSSSCN